MELPPDLPRLAVTGTTDQIKPLMHLLANNGTPGLGFAGPVTEQKHEFHERRHLQSISLFYFRPSTAFQQ